MNSSKLKIYLSQINNSVGDISGNAQKILGEFKKAEADNCDLIIFCEMALCGYSCEDLWRKKYFLDEVKEKIAEICEVTRNSKCAILLGAPHFSISRNKKEIVTNSAFFIEDGEIKKIINKKSLPNYRTFDEKRYFEADNFISLLEFRGLTIAVLICEDLWDARNIFLLKEQVLDLVISINSSPYSIRKAEKRLEIVGDFAKNIAKPIIYVNQVGAQDSLIFDGGSFVVNNDGKKLLQLKEFAEDFAEIEVKKNGEMNVKTGLQTPSCDISDITRCETGFATPSQLSCQRNYTACLLGLRDYIQKNNFKKVLLGMSGGIDSALVAAIAVDALGFENVALYALPSRYNSESSMIDAKNCAKNLGLNLLVISIEKPFEAMLSVLGEIKNNITEQNLQSRIRGNILMALSNDSGALLLSTGNKSELAMGYATIYGDMCGAFNPIKDLYKTQIYELVEWRNKNIPEISIYEKTNLIPQNIISKAPSAELRPNQKDSDSLPEYEILDKILYQIIEEEKSIAEIIKLGFEENLVKKIAKSFYASEYKRRQAVIGPKISKMSFDKDRRYPIVNNFIK